MFVRWYLLETSCVYGHCLLITLCDLIPWERACKVSHCGTGPAGKKAKKKPKHTKTTTNPHIRESKVPLCWDADSPGYSSGHVPMRLDMLGCVCLWHNPVRWYGGRQGSSPPVEQCSELPPGRRAPRCWEQPWGHINLHLELLLNGPVAFQRELHHSLVLH